MGQMVSYAGTSTLFVLLFQLRLGEIPLILTFRSKSLDLAHNSSLRSDLKDQGSVCAHKIEYCMLEDANTKILTL